MCLTIRSTLAPSSYLLYLSLTLSKSLPSRPALARAFIPSFPYFSLPLAARLIVCLVASSMAFWKPFPGIQPATGLHLQLPLGHLQFFMPHCIQRFPAPSAIPSYCGPPAITPAPLSPVNLSCNALPNSAPVIAALGDLPITAPATPPATAPNVPSLVSCLCSKYSRIVFK